MADKPSAYTTANTTTNTSAAGSFSSTPSTVFDADRRPYNQFSAAPSSFFNSFQHKDARHPLPRHQTPMATNSPPAANTTNTTHTPTMHSQPQQQQPQQPYAAQMAPPPPSASTKKLDISNLMSPPDAVMDSFHHGRSSSMSNSISPAAAVTRGDAAKQPLPMSPPISPYHRAASSHADPPATPPGQPVQDPVLYPHDDSAASASPPQPPLFATAELEHHRRIVDEHVRHRNERQFAGVSPPRDDEYALALSFRSQVMTHFTGDPRGWLRKERALLEADRRANGGQRYHTIMPAKPIAAKPSRSHRPAGVSKTPAAPRARAGNNAGNNGPMRPAGRVSATPEPSRRVVAPNREDKDFNSLPDYCPPLNSLPSRPNSLKVDWKGQPIDLSGDPHAHLLAPDEVTLAGNLRLDCATYLTSKRRIFERRLQCLRSGKEFRKTDAQQACKIDVNKASKLWTAFDKVGWLDAEWVRRFL